MEFKLLREAASYQRVVKAVAIYEVNFKFD
jgi:hypothetical protein